MSGWDQHNDNDREPDIEYRWLLGLTIVIVVGLILYVLRSWWLS